MAHSPELAAELEFVKDLALKAADVARERCQGVAPHEKANLTYVTDLDQYLEQLIRKRLGARFPDDVLTGDGGHSIGSGAEQPALEPVAQSHIYA